MITIRYHYKEQDDMSMKCGDVFFGRRTFEAWYEKNKNDIKNLTTIPNMGL